MSTHPDYAKLLAGKASPEYYTLADLRGVRTLPLVSGVLGSR